MENQTKDRFGKLQWAASKFRLDNLVAILDRNRIQQDGFTEDIMPLDPMRDKWSAFNWNVIEIDGHKVEQIIDALSKAMLGSR